MKNKMSQQEIESFALQYHGIDCVKMQYNSRILHKPIAAINQHYCCVDNIEYIELRSIDSLTDEELLKINQGLGLDSHDYSDAYDLKFYYENNIAVELLTTDYLRSIGIALPFRDHSVEEMIEQGILKLKK
jgi:hypothetical protein